MYREEEYRRFREKACGNVTIYDGITKADSVLNSGKYTNGLVSVSGGSDSDCVVDIVTHLHYSNAQMQYIFIDSGMEYAATKAHLTYLEYRYGISIERLRAVEPVPLAVKRRGYPFLSKHVSEMIGRLQEHHFRWEDAPFEVLLARYPECCSALKWWCNAHGKGSRYNIDRNKYLKEFLMAEHPPFRISAGCCEGAKKEASHIYISSNRIDLLIRGDRKAEGGARAKGMCLTQDGNFAVYRPLHWWKQADKTWYEKNFSVTHSCCYGKDGYGLRRTGCVGCPMSLNWQKELEAAYLYEPKMHKLCMAVFGNVYEYLSRYDMFRRYSVHR